MADIVKATRQYLLGKSAVTDLVVSRIYPHELPQGATLPAVVIEEVDADSDLHLGGFCGLRHTRLRVRSYGSERADARALRETVRTCGIVGYRGTTDGVVFAGVDPAGYGTGVDQPTDGSDDTRWYLWADYKIAHSEST